MPAWSVIIPVITVVYSRYSTCTVVVLEVHTVCLLYELHVLPEFGSDIRGITKYEIMKFLVRFLVADLGFHPLLTELQVLCSSVYR